MKRVLGLLRPDLAGFAPYESARPARDVIRLHANEAPWRADWDETEHGLNRYPDPRPARLIEGLAALYGVAPGQVLATRGSDDAIDVLARAFCRAGQDAIVTCPPTFGMYAVAAELQGAGLVEVPLDARFRVSEGEVMAACRPPVKLVFLCSPNNPTGNVVPAKTIETLCSALLGKAVVVVDEAYGEFADGPGAIGSLEHHPNLVVLKTLSKAYGLAGARCGALVAAPALVDVLRALLPPYPLPSLTVEAALKRLAPKELAAARRRTAGTVERREELARALAALPAVVRTWPSEANFVLTKFRDAAAAVAACEAAGILVRDFSHKPRLAGCLRITVGTAADNRKLIRTLETLPGSPTRRSP